MRSKEDLLPSPGVERRPAIRRFGVYFLALEAACGAVWWVLLFAFPGIRDWFLPGGVPDIMLLALILPDAVLFIGGAAVCAYALAVRSAWWRIALGIHAGAAGYAALYCIALSVLSPSTWFDAVFMMPSLTVPPLLLLAPGCR
jgi:hypothetical protein